MRKSNKEVRIVGYPTLIGEMAKKKITIESMAQCLGVHRNTISYKLNEGSFDIDEAFVIHKNFFPDWKMKELFKRE